MILSMELKWKFNGRGIQPERYMELVSDTVWKGLTTHESDLLFHGTQDGIINYYETKRTWG